MSFEGRKDLHRIHVETQQKYTYFVLAAAGAAIGFAITQSQTATLSILKAPLALAVLAWALSFYAGCRQLITSSNLMYQNYQMMRVEDGLHPEFPAHPQVVAMILESLEEQSSKAGRAGHLQFRLLLTGAVFYVMWHVIEMWARTPV